MPKVVPSRILAPLCAGETVYLRSGSPPLTVVDSQVVLVEWLSEDGRQRLTAPAACFERCGASFEASSPSV